jgi:hypothetical protein
MKRLPLALFLTMLFGVLVANGTSAQSEMLHLSMSRDWGYSSGTGDIQGLFSMKVADYNNLAQVEFFIDDLKIGEATQAPFKIQFSTDDYPNGIHSLYGVGYTVDGKELRTQVVSVNFVSADESWKTATKIIVPMVAILLVAITMSILIPAMTIKGKVELLPLGEKRKYGINGGGICPNCHRPFVMHMWGLNLGISRYDRCPYCGKWSIVRIQTLNKLIEAEKFELEWGKAEVKEESEEEKLRKTIDDSKFQAL